MNLINFITFKQKKVWEEASAAAVTNGDGAEGILDDLTLSLKESVQVRGNLQLLGKT